MRKSCVKTVVSVGKPLGIKSGFCPHVVATVLSYVGKPAFLYTANPRVLPLLSHSRMSKSVSVSRSLFHTIHSTYNKPQLIKLKYCY